MKPGDHPEFFRFPPPPGQSRESGIVLDADGRFWHRAERVAHPRMEAAFATWIRRHPDDGRYVLSNGYDWSYFEVQGTPFFVRAIRVDPAGLRLSLSDGNEELLDPATLRVGPRDALIAAVKGGAFEARFTPSAQTALAPHLEETHAGGLVLRIGGAVFPLTLPLPH